MSSSARELGETDEQYDRRIKLERDRSLAHWESRGLRNNAIGIVLGLWVTAAVTAAAAAIRRVAERSRSRILSGLVLAYYLVWLLLIPLIFIEFWHLLSVVALLLGGGGLFFAWESEQAHQRWVRFVLKLPATACLFLSTLFVFSVLQIVPAIGERSLAPPPLTILPFTLSVVLFVGGAYGVMRLLRKRSWRESAS